MTQTRENCFFLLQTCNISQHYQQSSQQLDKHSILTEVTFKLVFGFFREFVHIAQAPENQISAP